MTIRQVDYDDYEPYVGNRPFVDVVLHGPGGRQGQTTCPLVAALVDTGADYTQLDLGLAYYVGLDPVANGVLVTVATAGGLVKLHELDVELEFLGQLVTVTAHFQTAAAPLLGRQGLFMALEAAGFESGEWLQKWYGTSRPTHPQLGYQAGTVNSGGARTRSHGGIDLLRWVREVQGKVDNDVVVANMLRAELRSNGLNPDLVLLGDVLV